MNRVSSFVSVLAATVLGGVALGQAEPAPMGTIQPGVVSVYPVGTTPPYAPRVADVPLVDNTRYFSFSSYVSGVAAGNTCWADDFSFTGGPYAGATGRTITGLGWLMFNGNTAPDNQVFYVRVRLYKASDFVFNGFAGDGTPMANPVVSPGVTPFYDQVYQMPLWPHNVGSFVIARPIAPATTIPIPDGTDNFMVQWQATSDAAGTLVLPASQATWGFCQSGAATATNSANPGVDTQHLARDQNGDLVLIGATATTTSNGDHRVNLDANGRAISPGLIVVYDGPAQNVTPTFNFGCLADGVTNRTTDVMANNQVIWYQFCLNSNATDNAGPNGHFLDMWTHGSTAGGSDTVIGLYDAAGNLLYVNDDDSASEFHSLLSFGIGRRAAIVAGGSDRDGAGYEGDQAAGIKGLTAASGPYLLGVAGFGAAFLPGRNVFGNWTGGSVSMHFETNTNGAALAPSVAPAATDLGNLLAPGGAFPDTALPGNSVAWAKFTTCRDAGNGNQLTLDFSRMDSTNTAGWAWGLFTGGGNLVDTGFSTGVPAARTYDGSAGNTLSAGTYYIALSYYGGSFDVATLASTDGRWHFRDRNGNNGFNAGVDVIVTWSDCNNFCCLSDYNGDGDVGTDADIQDFFACLGGNCCATCPPDADFNCDGDIGTDADIEAFFRVLSGNPC